MLECSLWNHGGEFAVLSEVHQQLEEQELRHESIRSMCLDNKMVNGKQLTIVFHVDDCKLSHVDSKVLDTTIDWLRQDYESVFEDGSGEMKVNRGKKHKYLGMSLDYTTQGARLL
jgi:hypothetical protein